MQNQRFGLSPMLCNYKLHGFHTNNTFHLNLLGKYNEVKKQSTTILKFTNDKYNYLIFYFDNSIFCLKPYQQKEN